MDIILLTIEQKNSIEGTMYAPDSYFNPIQDINNNWLISIQEQDGCSLQWIKDLPRSEYFPKPDPEI